MKKLAESNKPSHCYEFLVKNGMDEAIALEIDSYSQRKEKRRKRRKDRNEDKWK